MVSSFQFSNPSLLKLSFALNNGFETEDASQINISLESHVETQPGPEENSAVVVLNLLIGKKDDSAPFFIEAEEAALFRWNPEKVDAEHSEKLLKQNAPALLLSYLRPTISLITSASPYAAYDIPFMNFTE